MRQNHEETLESVLAMAKLGGILRDECGIEQRAAKLVSAGRSCGAAGEENFDL